MGDFFYYLTRNMAHFVPSLGSRTYADGMNFVPPTGPGLVLSNHISHFDPSFMMMTFPRCGALHGG